MKKIFSIFLSFLLFLSYLPDAFPFGFTGLTLHGVTTYTINDNDWHRKLITITGSTDGALTDYPVSINVHAGSGTDLGANVYLNGAARANFGDIRFTDINGNVLDYWREYNASLQKAIFWFKLPTIPASPDTVQVYMYYNHPTRSYSGDGHDVFTAFVDKDDADDFTSDKRWVNVSNPYKLDSTVNVDVAGATSGQWYANPASVRAEDGTYCLQYMHLNGTSANNASYVEGQISTDQGRTWQDRQEVYHDSTIYQSEIAGMLLRDDGTVDTFGLSRNSGIPVAIKSSASVDNCVSWPDQSVWTQQFGASDYVFGIPNDWQKIGSNWYAIGEIKNFSNTTRSAVLFKWDGTNMTKVSTLTNTPVALTEGAVASLGGNNLIAILRHSPGFNSDVSQYTIMQTSSDLGQTWSAQTDITDKVGIFQDPDLTWISGTPGNGVLMLHGRQGPNNNQNMGVSVNAQDNVAWFSEDNGTTWKNKTVIFANTQASGATTVGGYTTAIVENDFVNIAGWTDNFHSGWPSIGNKHLLKQLRDDIEVQAYSQNISLLATLPFDDGDMTRYSIESRNNTTGTPQSDILTFSFQDSTQASDSRALQYYVPRQASDIGYLNFNGASGSSVKLGNFSFDTDYVLKAVIDKGQTNPIRSITAYNADRSTTLGTATNLKYPRGTPTKIDTLAIGTDISSGRTFAHLSFILLRKIANVEPAITEYGDQETVVTYPN